MVVFGVEGRRFERAAEAPLGAAAIAQGFWKSMTDETVRDAPWGFWIVGTVALIWYAMGVANFFVQMGADSLAAYSETARALVEGRPAWATGAFAISQFGGALGCVLLLLRKSAAYYLFVASLFGVIVTVVHTLGMVASTIDLGPVEISGYILIPLVVSTFLIWYSRQAESKGWIG